MIRFKRIQKDDIEILDKINNLNYFIDECDCVTSPSPYKEHIFLDKIEGHRITGVIFKKDGSIIILYKKIRWKFLKKNNSKIIRS